MTPTKPVFRHVNQKGVAYYLHEGHTKTGKPRYYFAQTVGAGALEAMPEGYQVKESVNGVVSTAKSRPRGVPEADVETARRELARHAHLRRYRIDTKDKAIVVYEPQGGIDLSHLDMHALFGGRPGRLPELPARNFTPVMKFVRADGVGEDQYFASRMTYRGMGGWSHPLGFGSLPDLVAKYLRHLGKDSLFDLY